jgi:hypothetical protein
MLVQPDCSATMTAGFRSGMGLLAAALGAELLTTLI